VIETHEMKSGRRILETYSKAYPRTWFRDRYLSHSSSCIPTIRWTSRIGKKNFLDCWKGFSNC
jgi:hypothetical protein